MVSEAKPYIMYLHCMVVIINQFANFCDAGVLTVVENVAYYTIYGVDPIVSIVFFLCTVYA